MQENGNEASLCCNSCLHSAELSLAAVLGVRLEPPALASPWLCPWSPALGAGGTGGIAEMAQLRQSRPGQQSTASTSATGLWLGQHGVPGHRASPLSALCCLGLGFTPLCLCTGLTQERQQCFIFKVTHLSAEQGALRVTAAGSRAGGSRDTPLLAHSLLQGTARASSVALLLPEANRLGVGIPSAPPKPAVSSID